MSKRIATAILWFLAAWYLGAWIAFFLGIPDALGPILGIAAAAVFAGDPLGVIWTRPSAAVEPPALAGQFADEGYAEAA